MQLISKIWSFGSTKEEMVHLWTIFCHSVLEQSCVLWDGTLTEENKHDLERTQKSFAKLVLQEKYKNYKNALLQLNLDSLESRRQGLLLKFAKDGIKHNKLNSLFPLNEKGHTMETRKPNKYKVLHANTDRFRKSSIIKMQHLLNSDINTSNQ